MVRLKGQRPRPHLFGSQVVAQGQPQLVRGPTDGELGTEDYSEYLLASRCKYNRVKRNSANHNQFWPFYVMACRCCLSVSGNKQVTLIQYVNTAPFPHGSNASAHLKRTFIKWLVLHALLAHTRYVHSAISRASYDRRR